MAKHRELEPVLSWLQGVSKGTIRRRPQDRDDTDLMIQAINDLWEVIRTNEPPTLEAWLRDTFDDDELWEMKHKRGRGPDGGWRYLTKRHHVERLYETYKDEINSLIAEHHYYQRGMNSLNMAIVGRWHCQNPSDVLYRSVHRAIELVLNRMTIQKSTGGKANTAGV